MIYVLITFVPPDTGTQATFSHYFSVPYGTAKQDLLNEAEGWLSDFLHEGFHDSARVTRGGRRGFVHALDYELVVEPTLGLEA